MQARMSSRLRSGYSWRISSAVMPLARKSKIKDTQMRCPRMHGLPKQTFGLMVILERSSSRVIRLSPEGIERTSGCIDKENKENKEPNSANREQVRQNPQRGRNQNAGRSGAGRGD